MSWSVHAVGPVPEVEQTLKRQFAASKENTKSIPHELEAVEFAEKIVFGQLHFFDGLGGKQVSVVGNGSAWVGEKDGSSEFRLMIEPYYPSDTPTEA